MFARQGHAFATSAPVRVVVPTTTTTDENPGGQEEEELVDVPKDGKTVGEIVMRGNIAMHGYFNDPEATARAFDKGHFHSGDLAVWNPDGTVAIQDRSKDLIISGGEVHLIFLSPPSYLIFYGSRMHRVWP
jgi:acyl-CoA synthetase (AMP-forming)/AMP-acid ligase II